MSLEAYIFIILLRLQKWEWYRLWRNWLTLHVFEDKRGYASVWNTYIVFTINRSKMQARECVAYTCGATCHFYYFNCHSHFISIQNEILAVIKRTTGWHVSLDPISSVRHTLMTRKWRPHDIFLTYSITTHSINISNTTPSVHSPNEQTLLLRLVPLNPPHSTTTPDPPQHRMSHHRPLPPLLITLIS